jgi:hypothetical protein
MTCHITIDIPSITKARRYIECIEILGSLISWINLRRGLDSADFPTYERSATEIAVRPLAAGALLPRLRDPAGCLAATRSRGPAGASGAGAKSSAHMSTAPEVRSPGTAYGGWVEEDTYGEPAARWDSYSLSQRPIRERWMARTPGTYLVTLLQNVPPRFGFVVESKHSMASTIHRFSFSVGWG